MKKISIIGIGMDGIKTLTKEADDAINSADILIGAKRITDAYDKEKFISCKSAEIADFIKTCDYQNIAVLMSGDCGFYSGAKKLLPLLTDYEVNVICGISSPVYFCSKVNESWNDVKFISLHGRGNSIARNVASNKKTFFLLGGDITAGDICNTLCGYGLGEVKVHIGENLAYDDERIISGTAEDFKDIKTGTLTVMLVINENYEKSLKSCIPDGDFIRGKVPMTKAEVRGICVSGMEIESDSICWDIGAGTGSVSVETAMRCPEGKVYAVERNDEAVDLIDENKHKFKCDNIEIIKGDIKDIINDLPAPDCVFIGGSGGNLEEVINTAYNKNKNAKITVTAVSLETLFKACEALKDAEITQVSVTRTKKISDYTMLSAENPIYIIRGKCK